MKMKIGDKFHGAGNSSVDNLAMEFKENIAGRCFPLASRLFF
jgi:hypothetical protein